MKNLKAPVLQNKVCNDISFKGEYGLTKKSHLFNLYMYFMNNYSKMGIRVR